MIIEISNRDKQKDRKSLWNY